MASLRAFRVLVLVCALAGLASPPEAHGGFVNLEWDAPTTNADGSPLLDLAGYRVYAGASEPPCPDSSFTFIPAPAPNPQPGTTFAATLGNLAPGVTHFVRISAQDASGNESACTPAQSGVANSDLNVTPPTLNFGNVDIGQTSTVNLTVQNVSAAPLTGTVTAAAPFSVVGGALNLAPNTSKVVTVRFAPLTAQTFAGNLNVTTSGDDVSRPLSGTGVAATPAVVQFSQTNYEVAEGGTVTVTVLRTGGSHGGVTVQYAASDGTATSGSDYVSTSGTLTFAANQMSRTFTVTALQDTVAEGAETIALTLSNAAGGATLGSRSSATLTINDDEPSLRFSAATYTVAETAGIATVTVTRVGSTANTVTVDYATTAAGTATPGPGRDFTPVTGTLHFATGQVSRSFTVPILDDHVVDGVKTVGLSLSNPVSASLGTPSMATIVITDNDVGGVIQFGAASYTVQEAGGDFGLPVNRAGGTAANVTVTYAVTGGTATYGVDYSLPGGTTSGTLTFAAGQMSVVLPITIINDSLREGPETIQLQLSVPGGGGTLGSIKTAVVTIDEAALDFSPSVYSVNEGGTATITVARTGPVSQTATVGFTTVSGTAVEGVDFVSASGTLTFAPGIRSRAVTIRTLPNFTVNGARSILLRLSAPSNATLGAQSTAVVTIGDDDTGGTVRFGAGTYTLSERKPTTFNVPVIRSGGTAGNVTVQYAVSGGTAVGGGTDFVLGGTGTLTFNAGQTTASIPIAVVNDSDIESDKTIVLQLSNPTGGATLGTPVTTTVTIADDDRTSTIQFSVAAYIVSESNGAATISLVRAGALANPVTVDFITSDGTATSGVDYTSANQTVTFGIGQAMRSVSVPVAANSLAEGPRTVRLALANATAPAALGARSSALLTIQDDDSTVQFSATGTSVSEGAAAAVTVTRTGNLVGTVTVPFTLTGGTAVSGVDFTLNPRTLTFGPGVASQTFNVQTLADAAVEGDETVELTLAPPTGNATLGVVPTFLLTIVDVPQRVGFSAPTYAVSEALTLATITVTRSSRVGQVTVDYAATGGTATNGGPSTDYNLAAGTLTFGAGQMTRTFTVAIANDVLTEGPETVTLTLSAPSGALLGPTSIATLTILDNEPQVQFSAANYTVTEGTATATITVTRTGTTTTQTTVNYAASGGTAGGGDFTLVAGTLTFLPGQTSRSFTFAILDNALAEVPETVILALSGPVNAALGPQSTATLTIKDNEPQVRFNAATYSVAEGTPSVTITVLRTGLTNQAVTVDFAATGGTATGGGTDFTLGAGTLTFAPGQTSRTFTLNVIDDVVMEGGETVVVTLTNPTGASLGTPSTATLSILDNDVAGTVEFTSPTYSAVEGGQATITVQRRGGAAGNVTVHFVTSDGTATAPTDYAPTSGVLTFDAGVMTRTFSIPLVDNGGPNAGRSVVNLTLSSPAGGAVLGRATAVLFIVDDD